MLLKCSECGNEISIDATSCPKCGSKKPLKGIVLEQDTYKELPLAQQFNFINLGGSLKYPKWTKIALSVLSAIIVIVIIIGIFGPDTPEEIEKKKQEAFEEKQVEVESKPEVSVVDFSNMEINDIATWCEKNKVECYTKEEYSDTITKGSFVSQNVKSGDKINHGKNITIVYSLGKEPSQEYKNALSKAVTYSENMYMSKKAIYNQLISQYGEQFPKDAAQYAIDNVVADWNINALQKAKTYQETMHMSKKAIYDQLISQYGEQFNKTEAQYAIDHLGN